VSCLVRAPGIKSCAVPVLVPQSQWCENAQACCRHQFCCRGFCRGPTRRRQRGDGRHHIQCQSARGAEHRLSGDHDAAGEYRRRDRGLCAGLVQGRLFRCRRLDVGRLSARAVEPAGDRAAGTGHRAGAASSSAAADLSSACCQAAPAASSAAACRAAATSAAAGNSSAASAASSSASYTSTRNAATGCWTKAAGNPSAAATPSAGWWRRPSASGRYQAGMSPLSAL
jgi:hypothetical protein